MLDSEEKPSFKLLNPLFVVYEDEDMKDKVESSWSHYVITGKPMKAGKESRGIKG